MLKEKDLIKIRRTRELTEKEALALHSFHPTLLGSVSTSYKEAVDLALVEKRINKKEHDGLLYVGAIYFGIVTRRQAKETNWGAYLHVRNLLRPWMGRDASLRMALFYDNDLREENTTYIPARRCATTTLREQYRLGNSVFLDPSMMQPKNFTRMVNDRTKGIFLGFQPEDSCVGNLAKAQYDLELLASDNWREKAQALWDYEKVVRGAYQEVDALIARKEAKKALREEEVAFRVVSAHNAVWGLPWGKVEETPEELVSIYGLRPYTRVHTPQTMMPAWAEAAIWDAPMHRVDLSQAHICVLAKVSDDAALIEDLSNGVDVYTKCNPNPSKYSRPRIKTLLQTLLNDTSARRSKKAVDLYRHSAAAEAFSKHYPDAFQFLLDLKDEHKQGIHYFGNHYETLIKEECRKILGDQFFEDVKHEHDGFAHTSLDKIKTLQKTMTQAATNLEIPYLRAKIQESSTNTLDSTPGSGHNNSKESVMSSLIENEDRKIEDRIRALEEQYELAASASLKASREKEARKILRAEKKALKASIRAQEVLNKEVLPESFIAFNPLEDGITPEQAQTQAQETSSALEKPPTPKLIPQALRDKIAAQKGAQEGDRVAKRLMEQLRS